MSIVIILLSLITFILLIIHMYINNKTVYSKISWFVLLIAIVGLGYGVLTP